MSTKPPAGTRDFLPDAVRRREHVLRIVRNTYERYGFEPLETPAFENIETLLGKYGEEGNRLIFKILRRGEHEASGQADLALRYDLTVPLARVVAQYQNELPRVFKRYQIQPVWRADRPARGRFREFYQCDVDTVGSTSTMVEAEQIAAVSEVLRRLGFQDFTVRLNHRELLSALLEAAGVEPPLREAALVAIDKLDKIGADGVRAELVGRGISVTSAEQCLNLFESVDDFDALHTRLAAQGLERGVYALDQIADIRQLASAAGADRIVVDTSLARGLSYYTGAIMEITVPDLAGSLGGGGRYDNLVGMFLGRDVPACGFSLGLERILVVMEERAMFPPDVTAAAVDVMVTVWNHASRPDATALATELRGAGLRVDVYPEADKVGKQFKYASGRNVPFVTVVGDDERVRGEVSIKDLRSGDQKSMPRREAAEFIRQRLLNSRQSTVDG